MKVAEDLDLAAARPRKIDGAYSSYPNEQQKGNEDCINDQSTLLKS